MKKIVDKLKNEKNLNESELLSLLKNDEINEYLFSAARTVREEIYKKDIYIRGLIEISNYCKNDCYYCGIRKSNKNINRYRLTKDDMLSCCKEGYKLGFRTFVLQGGEDMSLSEKIVCDIICEIKNKFPDCAVTLSLGEKSEDEYKAYFNAGADRYLLRHETADEYHYSRLHPENLLLENRKKCLYNLKKIGFQTGCGFMVGSPYQTMENIISDLKFIKEFEPHMVGIGPFIPHSHTPFSDFQKGSADLTVKLLAIVRLMLPNVLLPATTALATADKNGRIKGIMAGANVVMPNLSPLFYRKDYALYNDKVSTGLEGAEQLEALKKETEEAGFKILISKGDYKNV